MQLAQQQRRKEECARIEQDRKRRGQQLDETAGHARADQRGRRFAERDLRVRLDQPLAAGELRQQHLVSGAAHHVLHAAEETDGEQDVDRQRAHERRNRYGEQRRAACQVRGDDDGQLAHAVEQHTRVQRHERERQRLERHEDAHLQRRGVQQQRRRQRQREVGDLGAERRDRQRDPELPEILRPPEAAKRAAEPALQAIHVDTCQTQPDENSIRRPRTMRERTTSTTGGNPENHEALAAPVPAMNPAGNPAGA